MKYLVTTEDGEHFVIAEYTEDEFNAMCDGLITIIRLSDGKILDENKTWLDLPVYGEW
jgi:hypothetical protein